MITPNQKIIPTYAYQLLKRPKANPIFITVDWRCLNYIKRRNGLCLFCKSSGEFSFYDFSLCYQREIWVIYVTPHDYKHSLQLGRSLQLAGAKKVLIIAMEPELLSEANYAS